MKIAIDGLLGRVTMYRLVTLALALLAAVSLLMSALGQISYKPAALLATLVTVLVVTVLSGRVFALLFRATAHTESSVITALLLFFILQPTTDRTTLAQVALGALFAGASKYVLAIRGRHIFNPAAVGAVWLTLFHFYLAFWWVGTPALLPFTVVLAAVVLYRVRRFPLAIAFVVLAGGILLARNLMDGATLGAAVKFAVAQSPLVFFAGFMLSEPLTLPPTRMQQFGVAVVVAVLFGIPITIGSFTVGPETALIVGNALAFAFGQRRRIQLRLTARHQVSPTWTEFVFEPAGRLKFSAGQYLELAVPHRSTDSRGSRRMFSIASDPGRPDAVRIGVKIPERASSFKRALADLPIGSSISATGVSGDFRLPTDPSRPLLLIAGGIGITPFLSQLAELRSGPSRDVVLIHAVTDDDALGYSTELAASGVRVVLVGPVEPADLPGNVESRPGRLDQALLAELVPDMSSRRVLISGPPGLVDTIGRAAKGLKPHSIDKDYFTGYAPAARAAK